MNLHELQSPPGPVVVIDGREFLYFGGCGYLGLQGDPRLAEAAGGAVRQYGLHTATSRRFLESPLVRQVEQQAARFLGAEDAFYFATGYAGPAILLQYEARRFDSVLIDAAAHYSLFDAVDASGLPRQTFAHADPHDLAERLADSEGRVLVATDGLFSALGDVAPLDAYIDLLQDRPGSGLLVDDAHGLGTLGSQGRGTLEHFFHDHTPPVNTHEDACPRLLCCATLSKAIGGYGGIIAGSAAYIEVLKQASSFYGGATPPPTPVAAASLAALRIVDQEPQRREALAVNTRYLREQLRAIGLSLSESASPIISSQLGDAARMRGVQESLQAQGIVIAYFSSYAGLGGEGALRIAVFATHTRAMLDRLADTLEPMLP